MNFSCLCLLAFLSFLVACSALQCYDCIVTELGVGDPKCNDPFYDLEPPYIRECDDKIYKKCRKIKTYLANDKIRLVRECAPSCPNEGCKNYQGQWVCEHCCYGDGCNGAGAPTPDTRLLVPVLVATLVRIWQ